MKEERTHQNAMKTAQSKVTIVFLFACSCVLCWVLPACVLCYTLWHQIEGGVIRKGVSTFANNA